MAFGKKTHATITAPLKKMADDLSSYVAERESENTDFDRQMAELQTKKVNNQVEIQKSLHTSQKIAELLGTVEPQ